MKPTILRDSIFILHKNLFRLRKSNPLRVNRRFYDKTSLFSEHVPVSGPIRAVLSLSSLKNRNPVA